MSLDVQLDLNPQARVVEVVPEPRPVPEQLENALIVLATGLGILTISTMWVWLSLS